MIHHHRIDYFGKIPSRGDFIKAADDLPLMGVLDQWLAQSMHLLAANAHWKQMYDAMAPLEFAFIGPRRKHAIAGRILASSDQSGRRYPFLMMHTIDVADPATFLARSVLPLEALWRRMDQLARAVLEAPDPAPPLHAIPETPVVLVMARHEAFAAFLEQNSMASLSAMLDGARSKRLMLALGILLKPVMKSGTSRLDNSLLLPLPQERSQRYLVATFWLDLIAPFLVKADFELAVFLAELDHLPTLVLGFCGASAHTLHAIMDPQAGRKQQIRLDDSAWVDAQIASDTDIRRLANYLDQEQLPLQAARDLFRQIFLGL